MASKGGGLAGIVVGETALSDIDGQAGRLIYRGYDIHDLARDSSFEEVCYLLWYGRLPTAAELDALKGELKKERAVGKEVLDLVRTLATNGSPSMEALRTSVSALSTFDPDVEKNDEATNLAKAKRLTAKIPTLIAAYDRYRNGNDAVAPRDDLDHAANFLFMLFGEEQDDVVNRAMDVALVLHADHGYNASTFSARVTASTLSDMHSAITAAIATLKGPLHGGANERVMHMLEEVDGVDQADAFVRGKLERKEKIMGFGHRVYKTLDPRAVVLKDISEKLGERSGDTTFYELSKAIQKAVKDEKGLDANVDFYSASSYHSMGIPTDLFTPIFALSRVSGWTAHVIEQQAANKLIRPDAEYVGPKDLEYTPIGKR